jgi:hypothetical protein
MGKLQGLFESHLKDLPKRSVTADKDSASIQQAKRAPTWLGAQRKRSGNDGL